MNVSLTPELEDLVADKVKSGLYNSASEVVRAALRLLSEQDDLRQVRLEALRKDVQIGLDQIRAGQSKTYSSGESLAADIKARGRAKLEAGTQLSSEQIPN